MGPGAAAATAVASSSLRSDHSTERLIRILPARRHEGGASLALTLGGTAQACAGALLLWCGGAALVRAAGAMGGPVRWAGGAALWAGGAAVAAGALAALAGLEGYRTRHADHHHRYRSGGLERAALALSLVGAACAHAAGALAAAALQRLRARPDATPHTFKEEMEAWSPVVASGAVLAAACVQCALSGLCAYVAARRVCPCLRPPPPSVPHTKAQLAAEDPPPKRASALALPPAPPPPLVLLPASSATLGRVRAGGVPLGVVVAPRYATLPLPQARPPAPRRPPHHPALYYTQHEYNTRRRQRRGGVGGGPAQTVRSLERVHRRRRGAARPDAGADAADGPPSDADLRRTYTGLDRAYAEQFIAVCDESRSQATDRSLSQAPEGDIGDRPGAGVGAAVGDPAQADRPGT